MEWIWQGLLTNWVAAAGIILGGFILGYLRANYPKWASVVMYGLGACALIGITLYAVRGFTTLPKQPPQTTIENVETNIKTWIDNIGLAVQKMADKESHFMYRVILPSTISVGVARTKSLDRYLTFQTKFVFPSEHQNMIEKLPKQQQEKVVDELILEMARLNIEWELTQPLLKSINLLRHVPITNNFTEDTLAANLHALGSAVILAKTKPTLILLSNP